VITQCCIQSLYDQGAEGQAAVDMAKEFERRKCNHFKQRPEDECMIAMAGTLFSPSLFPRRVCADEEGRVGEENKNRYVIATQSLELRKELRKVAGTPIVYIARSVVLLETPSDQTLAKKSAVRSIFYFLLSFSFERDTRSEYAED